MKINQILFLYYFTIPLHFYAKAQTFILFLVIHIAIIASEMCKIGFHTSSVHRMGSCRETKSRRSFKLGRSCDMDPHPLQQ